MESVRTLSEAGRLTKSCTPLGSSDCDVKIRQKLGFFPFSVKFPEGN